MKESKSITIVIFKPKELSSVKVLLEDETVWLTQKQMSELFDCSIDNISLHMKNIFREKELEQNSVIEYFSITAKDGKQYKTKHYSLDAILSVGYRVKSIKATEFRRWSNSVLKEHLIEGYTINRDRLDERKIELEIKESSNIMNKIFLIKGVDQSEKNSQIIEHVSKYIGSTTDKETMVLKAQILIERFMIQFLKEQSKNEKALDNSRFTFRHLVTLSQLQHEPEEKVWLWELLNKLCKIRNNFAHILEVELIETEIEDFVRVSVLRLKKEGVSIQNKDNGLKFILVHLCGIVYTVLSLRKQS